MSLLSQGFNSIVCSEKVDGPTIEDCLSDTERTYYFGLLDLLDPIGHCPAGNLLVEFLQKSGLERGDLGAIWRYSVKRKDSKGTLTKLEFMKTMRCIALLQNNVQFNSFDTLIMANNFPFLAYFTGIPKPQEGIHSLKDKPNVVYPSISAQELIEYEEFINKVDF